LSPAKAAKSLQREKLGLPVRRYHGVLVVGIGLGCVVDPLKDWIGCSEVGTRVPGGNPSVIERYWLRGIKRFKSGGV